MRDFRIRHDQYGARDSPMEAWPKTTVPG